MQYTALLATLKVNTITLHQLRRTSSSANFSLSARSRLLEELLALRWLVPVWSRTLLSVRCWPADRVLPCSPDCAKPSVFVAICSCSCSTSVRICE